MRLLLSLLISLAHAHDLSQPVNPSCKELLAIKSWTFGSDFNEHVVRVRLAGHHVPKIASGGHTYGAYNEFAKLRPDLFPRGILGFSLARTDGAIEIYLPRDAFTRKSWNRLPRITEDGHFGLRTVFPPNWTLNDIKTAALSIVTDPNSLFRSSRWAIYAEGRYRGLPIWVDVTGGLINRTYPSLLDDYD